MSEPLGGNVGQVQERGTSLMGTDIECLRDALMGIRTTVWETEEEILGASSASPEAAPQQQKEVTETLGLLPGMHEGIRRCLELATEIKVAVNVLRSM